MTLNLSQGLMSRWRYQVCYNHWRQGSWAQPVYSWIKPSGEWRVLLWSNLGLKPTWLLRETWKSAPEADPKILSNQTKEIGWSHAAWLSVIPKFCPRSWPQNISKLVDLMLLDLSDRTVYMIHLDLGRPLYSCSSNWPRSVAASSLAFFSSSSMMGLGPAWGRSRMMYTREEAPKWKLESTGSWVGLWDSIRIWPMKVPWAEKKKKKELES